MSRRKLREHLFKLIFLYAFNPPDEMDEQVSLYFDGEPGISGEDREFLTERFRDLVKYIEGIDGLLNRTAKGWKTSRFPSCDLAILRLAVYEMRFDAEGQVPESVAINEAVELAKAYGGDESPAFVNGVLGEIARNPKE